MAGEQAEEFGFRVNLTVEGERALRAVRQEIARTQQQAQAMARSMAAMHGPDLAPMVKDLGAVARSIRDVSSAWSGQQTVLRQVRQEMARVHRQALALTRASGPQAGPGGQGGPTGHPPAGGAAGGPVSASVAARLGVGAPTAAATVAASTVQVPSTATAAVVEFEAAVRKATTALLAHGGAGTARAAGTAVPTSSQWLSLAQSLEPNEQAMRAILRQGQPAVGTTGRPTGASRQRLVEAMVQAGASQEEAARYAGLPVPKPPVAPPSPPTGGGGGGAGTGGGSPAGGGAGAGRRSARAQVLQEEAARRWRMPRMAQAARGAVQAAVPSSESPAEFAGGVAGVAGTVGEMIGAAASSVTDPAVALGLGTMAAAGLGLGAIGKTAMARNFNLASTFAPLARQFGMQPAKGNSLPQYWTRLLGGGASQGFDLTTSANAVQALLTSAGTLAGATPAQQAKVMASMFGVSRALGIAPGTMASTLGAVTQVTWRQVDPQKFAAMIGQAVTDASMQGRYGEFLHSLQSTLQSIGSSLVASSATWAATAVAGISSMAPAMRGTRAAQLAGQIQSGIASGSSSPAIQLMEYRAMAKPGMSYGELLFQQQNPWMVMPGQTKSGVQNLVQYIARQTGVNAKSFIGPNYVPGNNAASSAEIMLENATGISMSQAGMLLSNPNAFAKVAKTLQNPPQTAVAALTQQEQVSANLAQSWLKLATASQSLLPTVKSLTGAFSSLSSEALKLSGVLASEFAPKAPKTPSPTPSSGTKSALKDVYRQLGLPDYSGQAPSTQAKQAFVKSMTATAKRVSAATGFPTSFLLSQWAEESNWGTSTAAKRRLNFAGLGITGPNVTGPMFKSLQQFAKADVATLDSPKYKAARAYAQEHPTDIQGIAQRLQQGGYASDAQYGAHVASFGTAVAKFEAAAQTIQQAARDMRRPASSVTTTVAPTGGVVSGRGGLLR